MTALQYIVRPTTDEEFKAGMPYVTSSMIEAVNTCPRWGVIHNVLGKRFVTGYRQMALEAGSLMHDVFACLNLAHIGVFRELPDHMHFHAELLFGKERWKFIWEDASAKGDVKTDTINAFERLIFSCIGTSDYYDDPDDRNRTLANLEKCALELLQYWYMNLVQYPIYVADEKKPEMPIGIEMSLDAVFEVGQKVDVPMYSEEGDYIHEEEREAIIKENSILKMRCIGLADVLYQNQETKAITLGEYKTSSGMNDAWRDAFLTRHQITLYNALLQAYFGHQDEFNTILIGSAIPVRKTGIPVQHFTVDRDQENVQQLLNTFFFTKSIIDTFTEMPLETPMFTHSCNRYFRKCTLMDLCTAVREDQEVMVDTMEIEHAPSPSEQKALLRNM